MRLPTVVLSVGLHVGLAVGLVAVAQKRELRRRAISVAVEDEKKKAKPPKPPAPPRPIVHPAVAKVEPVAPKAVSAAPVAHAAAAPVAMNLAMSNTGLDVGPGIGLEGRAKPAAAPVKVASAISERRTQHTRDEAGGGSPDAPCEEAPSKPEPDVQIPIDYSLYPQAQADGIEGKFRARLVVDADGQVSDVIVVAGVDPSLDAAIISALKRWRFKPAMACGKPVAGGVWPHAWVFELGD
ncbi:MAG TPA: energy transducer TonB [Polyangia bacterium]|nr:energy transducer TonB [Polyangia bacterium]